MRDPRLCLILGLVLGFACTSLPSRSSFPNAVIDVTPKAIPSQTSTQFAFRISSGTATFAGVGFFLRSVGTDWRLAVTDEFGRTVIEMSRSSDQEAKLLKIPRGLPAKMLVHGLAEDLSYMFAADQIDNGRHAAASDGKETTYLRCSSDVVKAQYRLIQQNPEQTVGQSWRIQNFQFDYLLDIEILKSVPLNSGAAPL